MMANRCFLSGRGFINRKLLKCCRPSTSFAQIKEDTRGFGGIVKTCFGVIAGTIATCGAVVCVFERTTVNAAHVAAHPPNYPWGFCGLYKSLDHAAIRRGWLVYKTICSSCHSINYVAFRDLVNVCFTEEEVRKIAAEYEVEAGPDENGEYFLRPGKLSDRIPSPYPNEEAARAANNGAYPVDLSYIMNARHNANNYIFSLLTGYVEPPAGIDLRNGQGFSPYFEGGALGMAEMLQDGLVEYDDGTPAYKSQMAKDIVEFLMWTGNQEWDTRKVVFFKGLLICFILLATFYPSYRRKMAVQKHIKVCFIPRLKK